MTLAGTPVADGLDLARVDAAVEAAVVAGEAGDLRVLGYGEITLVVGWPSERPAWAVKRLPPFRSAEALQGYQRVLDRYVATLRERGVDAVGTELHALPPGPSGIRAYLVQPLMPVERELPAVLRRAEHPQAKALLDQLAAHVTATVDGSVGIDAQASNWVLDERGGLRFMDVSTPMLRRGGRDELDTSLFISVYPWALRPGLRLAARSVMGNYFDPRMVLIDVGSNLLKERLDHLLPAFLEAVDARLARPIAEAEVRSYFARDARFWMLMQRLRRVDRAWQRRVRRRPYPMLLPPPYDYASPQRPERTDGR